MKSGISASMMCANLLELKKDLRLLENAKVDYLHVDIMDGEFVPNYSLGTDFIKLLRRNSAILLDIHLMIEKPDIKIDYLEIMSGDCVSIHAESCTHLQRVIKNLKNKGVNVGVAYNPATPIDNLSYIYDLLDFVLIMTVNPGYSGQVMVPLTIEKIKETRRFLDNHGVRDVKIEVDGNVSIENAILMKAAGADIFVLGTSTLFKIDTTIEAAAEAFREIVLSENNTHVANA